MSKSGRTFAIAALLAAGCADSTTAARVTDLQQKLEAQQRRTAADEHKLDELENRVFLLTDQVESQKVAALHRDKPRPLPVVRLKPDEAHPADDAHAADETVVSDEGGEEIVYEGDARTPSTGRARTVLRIDGTRVASAARHGEPVAKTKSEPLSVSSEDNLGVAPVPPIHGTAPVEHAVDRSAPGERAAPAIEPLTLYRTAYDDLRAGRHEAAERGFREFVRRFPHHDYADNAQYWLGECFYDQKRFDKAAPEFRAVVQRWPTGNKAPDALLKLGFTELALGEIDKGQKTLRELPASYPHTEAARLAVERLAQLSPSSTEAPK